MKKKKSIIPLIIFIFILLFTSEGYIPFEAGSFLIIVYIIVWSFIKSNNKKIEETAQIEQPNVTTKTTKVILKCTKCNSVIKVDDKFCATCGEAITGDNVRVEESTENKETTQNVIVKSDNYDPIFKLSEDEMVEEFINRELVKAKIDKNSKLIPFELLKRKRVFNIIFSILLFVFVCMIFFHFPLVTYIVGIFILIIFYKLTRNYDLMSYLKKQLKSRPSEKASNIVMSVKESFVEDKSNKILLFCSLTAILLPLLIFIKPVILYEKMDNGYGVRYYAFGVTNFKTVTIPEKYKGMEVISLRGNTFSNMPFLTEVNLPNTIIEIRGQAFKNDKKLVKVNIPNKLVYLGGGAFYNCKSIKSIELPDTLTYLGGESFYNAKSLEEIKLSNSLTEIRGNTFENCKSLKSITIPDSVTRIGGHAFYGNSSLSSVIFTENSKLNEIGSSAFRMCDSLYEITIPRGTYVNSRAFKESPTDVRYFDMVKTNSYNHSIFVYLKIGETKKINEYFTNAQIQNSYITLENIIQNNGLYEFTLKYSDEFGEQIITMNSQYPKIEINNNLVLEIDDDYVFNYYNDKIALTAYYN